MTRTGAITPSHLGFDQLATQLAEIGRHCYGRGWVLGTSGNFSAVVNRDPLRLAITTSGVDKGALSSREIVQIDELGRLVAGSGQPSAEASLHLTITRLRGAGAVLHTHSIWGTILSDAAGENGLAIEGYEMLKGLDGVTTHHHREWLPILENTQDWAAAVPAVEAMLSRQPNAHGFLIRRHGLYTWGRDLDEASRHLEALEFLFEVMGRKARHDMASVRIPDENRTLTDQAEVTSYLATLGIDYERWPDAERVPQQATADEVLAAYAPEIEQLKAQGSYVTADVIDVTAQTPNLEVMLDKFRTEHWHDEDEVRFIVRGRGLFHVHPREGSPVIAIEVEAGDLIRVPRGTWHWFDLCGDRDIRAIRLFQDKSGWTPHYTNSGADRGYQPLCLGPTYIPLRAKSS